MDKAQLFNKFFTEIGEDLAAIHGDFQEETSNQFIVRVTPTTAEHTVTYEMLSETLRKKLNPRKAIGPDNIAAKDLHLAGESIIHGLFYIFKKSLDCGKYPNQWKTSCLKPIFKAGAIMDRSNFRPISLLSIPGKLLENIPCMAIDNHLTKFQISSDQQWGFKEGRSSETLLLHLTETWKEELDKGNMVGIIFLDFRKAFDTVNLAILKEKLKAVGICGNLYSLVEDYLSNRSQFTRINGVDSEKRPVTVGVPQGSLLGPRLYSIYVNDFPESIKSGKAYLFADDTTIYAIGKNTDDIHIKLQKILNEVYSWCSQNRLSIHNGKTEAMIVSRRPFVGPMQPLTCGNAVIEYKAKSDCLGLRLDNRLSWESQIKKICLSFNGKIKALKHIRFLQKHILEAIYFKTVLPSILYGLAVWGSCSPSLFNNLEEIHLRAAKLIHGGSAQQNNGDILAAANWQPLQYFYKKRILSLVHSAYFERNHADINHLVERNPSNYNLRSVKVTRPRTEMGRLTFKHRAALAWNSLPVDLKSIGNTQAFKVKINLEKSLINRISFDKDSCMIINKDDYFYYY